MTRTVDLVIVGVTAAATAAAVDAVRRDLRVLMVIRGRDFRVARRQRHLLLAACAPRRPRIVILTGAEVACVDGVHGIEAVVVRHLRTGRLTGFNAAALFAPATRMRKPRSTH